MSLGASRPLKWTPLTLFPFLSTALSSSADVPDNLSLRNLSLRITPGTIVSTKSKIALGTCLSCLISATIRATTTTPSL